MSTFGRHGRGVVRTADQQPAATTDCQHGTLMASIANQSNSSTERIPLYGFVEAVAFLNILLTALMGLVGSNLDSNNQAGLCAFDDPWAWAYELVFLRVLRCATGVTRVRESADGLIPEQCHI
jgi:hypothetical protein